MRISSAERPSTRGTWNVEPSSKTLLLQCVCRMTTGGVLTEKGGGNGGSEGHRKMAAALSHILTPSDMPAQVKEQSARVKAFRVGRGKRKRDVCEKRSRQREKLMTMSATRKERVLANKASTEEHRSISISGSKESEEEAVMMDSESSGEAATDDDDGDGASELSESCGVVAGCRQRPDVACLDHERKLQRVATTGVVQLFNAVSQHKKEVEAKVKAAGPSERKKAKVLSTVDKGSFIDLLKGRKPQEESSKWPILSDDYMLGAKIRDWGKEEEEGKRERGSETKPDRGSSSSDTSE